MSGTSSADLLGATYTRSVEAAGGRRGAAAPQAQGPRGRRPGSTALIVTGGADVEPARYGAEPAPRTYVRPDRDAWELALLDAADARRRADAGASAGACS